MNKKVNIIFSTIGLLTEIFYFLNAINIWIHHIGISFSNIIDSIPKILIVCLGLILTIVSLISYKDNYKCTNIVNYVSLILLLISTVILLI